MAKNKTSAAIEYPELDPVNERYTRSWAEQYGEDMSTGYEMQDQPPPPGPRSTPTKIVQGLKKARQQDRRRQHREVNEAAGQIEDRREAYERVQEARRTRRPSSPADQAKAARHALETGIVKPKSTVQQLIEQGRRQRRDAS
jgi:hypothetical protein